MLADQDRLAIRQALSNTSGGIGRSQNLQGWIDNCALLLEQLDAEIAARQQAEQERDVARHGMESWKSFYYSGRSMTPAEHDPAKHKNSCARFIPEDDIVIRHFCGVAVYNPVMPCTCGADPNWKERADAAEQQVTTLTQQLKDAEGRLGIVEVEDGKIQGIRITPARDLEYERRVRAEENLKVATDQLANVTKDRGELDRTARELLDEARRQITALRAALEQYGHHQSHCQCFGYALRATDISCTCGFRDAALAGSRAPTEEPEIKGS